MMLKRVWGGREKWSATRIPPGDDQSHDHSELEPTNAFKGGSGLRWSQMRGMKVNDYYLLDLRKPRVLDRIVFWTEGEKYPERYRIEVRAAEKAEWEDLGVQSGPIEKTFEHPRKIEAIRVTVVEPRKYAKPRPIVGDSPAWSIHDIRLREVRLFEKLWHREIR